MSNKFIKLLLAGILLSSAGLLLSAALSDRIVFSICIAIFLFGTMAGWLFITSLRAFKKELRVAYYILAAGVLLFGLGQIQLPLLSLITIDVSLGSVLTVLVYFIGLILAYLGVRKFARLLGIRNLWSSFIATVIISAALGWLASIVVGIAAGRALELIEVLVYGGFVAGGGFGLMAAVLTLKARKKLGPSYKSAMGWLAAALFIAGLASFHETAVRAMPFIPDYFYNYGLNLWTYVLATILFLKASLAFREISRQFEELPEDASYLDVINFAAQQVSDPTAIDVTLDKVREITATQKPGVELSAANKTQLLKVYTDIEQYLVTKEPLRKVTRDELRLKLPDEFRQGLAA